MPEVPGKARSISDLLDSSVAEYFSPRECALDFSFAGCVGERSGLGVREFMTAFRVEWSLFPRGAV